MNTLSDSWIQLGTITPGKARSKPQAALYNLVCFDDHINYRGQRNLIFLPVDLTASPQLL